VGVIVGGIQVFRIDGSETCQEGSLGFGPAPRIGGRVNDYLRYVPVRYLHMQWEDLKESEVGKKSTNSIFPRKSLQNILFPPPPYR